MEVTYISPEQLVTRLLESSADNFCLADMHGWSQRRDVLFRATRKRAFLRIERAIDIAMGFHIGTNSLVARYYGAGARLPIEFTEEQKKRCRNIIIHYVMNHATKEGWYPKKATPDWLREVWRSRKSS